MRSGVDDTRIIEDEIEVGSFLFKSSQKVVECFSESVGIISVVNRRSELLVTIEGPGESNNQEEETTNGWDTDNVIADIVRVSKSGGAKGLEELSLDSTRIAAIFNSVGTGFPKDKVDVDVAGELVPQGHSELTREGVLS